MYGGDSSTSAALFVGPETPPTNAEKRQEARRMKQQAAGDRMQRMTAYPEGKELQLFRSLSVPISRARASSLPLSLSPSLSSLSLSVSLALSLSHTQTHTPSFSLTHRSARRDSRTSVDSSLSPPHSLSLWLSRARSCALIHNLPLSHSHIHTHRSWAKRRHVTHIRLHMI